MIWLLACTPKSAELGDFSVSVEEQSLKIEHQGQPLLDLQHVSVGTATADIQFQSGSYLFSSGEQDWQEATRWVVRETDPLLQITLENDEKEVLATMGVSAPTNGTLLIQVEALDPGVNRLKTSFDCRGKEPILGTGAQAMDVDHHGEAFPLFVSEPGIGKIGRAHV